jgi:hypothetical protein
MPAESGASQPGQIEADSCERDPDRDDDDDPLGRVQPVYEAHGPTMPVFPGLLKRPGEPTEARHLLYQMVIWPAHVVQPAAGAAAMTRTGTPEGAGTRCADWNSLARYLPAGSGGMTPPGKQAGDWRSPQTRYVAATLIR